MSTGSSGTRGVGTTRSIVVFVAFVVTGGCRTRGVGAIRAIVVSLTSSETGISGGYENRRMCTSGSLDGSRVDTGSGYGYGRMCISGSLNVGSGVDSMSIDVDVFRGTSTSGNTDIIGRVSRISEDVDTGVSSKLAVVGEVEVVSAVMVCIPTFVSALAKIPTNAEINALAEVELAVGVGVAVVDDAAALVALLEETGLGVSTTVTTASKLPINGIAVGAFKIVVAFGSLTVGRARNPRKRSFKISPASY
jgi:hypothetical protein